MTVCPCIGFSGEGHDVTKFWLCICVTSDRRDNMEALQYREHCMQDVNIRVHSRTELKVSISAPPAQLDVYEEQTDHDSFATPAEQGMM